MRIIAGSARGRSIEAPKGRDTRPTLDRVREAIFGMVQFDVEDASVLDLFAGSGALGLEALSRGAGYAAFCDNSASACAVVGRNLQTLGFADRAEVFHSDCFALLERLSRTGRRFSLVLIDPPYQAGLYEKTLDTLTRSGVLEDGCIIILEHPKRMRLEPCSAKLKLGKPHSYGDIAVTKLVYSEECEEDGAQGLS
ncbi:MAG: 16S rRNA (guanine(966)-N(2))-methyltransferase RsmD [Clostridia bacterium]|nr:16S rRNA (guanine(966)-N(2))-methyltransferase RsmD [Clostridia bacterium]